MRQLAVFTHILPYGTRVGHWMAGPRASDGEGRRWPQGTDLLNIAGEKMAGSGTLGYLYDSHGGWAACPPPYSFRKGKKDGDQVYTG